MSALYDDRPLDEWTKAHREAFLERVFELAFRRLAVGSLEDLFGPESDAAAPRAAA
jgi:hypothetical protein